MFFSSTDSGHSPPRPGYPSYLPAFLISPFSRTQSSSTTVISSLFLLAFLNGKPVYTVIHSHNLSRKHKKKNAGYWLYSLSLYLYLYIVSHNHNYQYLQLSINQSLWESNSITHKFGVLKGGHDCREWNSFGGVICLCVYIGRQSISD